MHRHLLGPALVTGICLGFSFPLSGSEAVPQGWLALFAFTPLLHVGLVRNRVSPGESYAYALVAHLVAYGVAFQWVHFHPMAKTAVASMGGLLILALLSSLPWAGAAWIRRRTNPALALAAWSVLVLALEHGLSRGPWALPWTVLSLTQADLPYAGIAATLGATGLSAIVLATNSTIAHAIDWPDSLTGTFDQPKTKSVHSPLVALGALAALIAIEMSVPGGPPDDNAVPRSYVRVIQPAMPATRWARTDSLTKVEHLLDLTLDPTRTTRPGPSFLGRQNQEPAAVVWPETALPPAFFDAPDTSDVHRAIQSLSIPLISGAVRPYGDSTLSPYRRYTNDVLVFRSGDMVAQYSKRHLVPFAERVPLIDDLPFLRVLTVPAGGVAGYVRGSGPTIFEVPSAEQLRIAPLICFETILSPYVRRIAEKEPHVLLAVSQIGWWKHSSILPQYRALTSLRARETGIPIVVATVSGPTFTALPDGRTQTHLGWMQAGAIDVPIPTSTSTAYRSFGIWIDAAVMATLFVFVYIAGSVQRR